MRVFMLIAKAVVAVTVTTFTVVGWLSVIPDTRDVLGLVSVWGWSWFELAFAITNIAFWVIVVSLYVKVHKLERKQPKLSVIPLGYKDGNIAYLEVHNKGGYTPSCIANVTHLSRLTVVGGQFSETYLNGVVSVLHWDTSERTTNMPNDGVRRRIMLAELFSGGWRFPEKTVKREFPPSWYKLSVTISFEAETTYTRRLTIALGCRYDGGIGKFDVRFWEDWLDAVSQNYVEAINGTKTNL